jgi:hypothetical protein
MGKDINQLQSLVDKLEELERKEAEEKSKQKDKIKDNTTSNTVDSMQSL